MLDYMKEVFEVFWIFYQNAAYYLLHIFFIFISMKC